MSLATYIYRDIDQDEIAAFIAHNGGDIYTKHDIFARMKKLEITWKRSSTEAYNFFSPDSIEQCIDFFNYPLPLRVVSIEHRHLCDIDVASFALDTIATNFGYFYKTAWA